MLLRVPAGFLRRNAAADVLFGATIDVELPLFGDLAVYILTVKKRPQAHTEFREPAHGKSPSGGAEDLADRQRKM